MKKLLGAFIIGSIICSQAAFGANDSGIAAKGETSQQITVANDNVETSSAIFLPAAETVKTETNYVAASSDVIKSGGLCLKNFVQTLGYNIINNF